MKTAFETAIEISYYAGKLWDVATDPDISRGGVPVDYTATRIVIYPEANPDKFVLSAQVPQMLVDLFGDVARKGIDESDDVTSGTLSRSVQTLSRLVDLQDPVEGCATSFSNLQRPLKEAMPRIRALAESLNVLVP